MLTVDAIPTNGRDVESFRLDAATPRACVLCLADRQQHLLLTDRNHHLQIRVRAGTLLEGPVRFRYVLEGFTSVAAELRTLERLIYLQREGKFSTRLRPPERRAPRWIMMLRTIDALDAGATLREIASVLVGAELARDDWRAQSDYLRLRVQRLARAANNLRLGSYRRLIG